MVGGGFCASGRAGLNNEETEDMARYLLDIKEELGISLLLIEHDLGLVMDLADIITVLDFGYRWSKARARRHCLL